MSTYSVPVGASGDTLDIQTGFFGSPIRYKGEILKTKFHFGYRSAEVQTGDGQTHAIEVRPDYLDTIPKIVVDGAEAMYRTPQPGWAKALALVAYALFPVGVCVVGGWVAALIGAIAGYLVLYMSREMENKSTAMALSILAVIVAWGLWLALSIAVILLYINRAG